MPPDTDRAEESLPAAEAVGRKRRRWPWILLGLGLIAVLGTVFLAPLAIAPLARSALVRAGEERGYTVSVASASFGWLEGLRLEGITARETIPHGVRAEIEAVELAPRWRGLLAGRLALGRCRIERPVVVVDPERKPPASRPPRERARTGAESSAESGREEGAAWEVDLPLAVTDGRLEVLPSPERPGFRLEKLNVHGHFYGAENRVNGVLRADLISGEHREPLQLNGDVLLGSRDRPPSGSAYCAVGGVDLAGLRPVLAGTPLEPLRAGILRLDGEARAEGRLLVIRARVRVEGLRVVARAGAAPVLEEPEVRLDAEAVYDPEAQRLEVRRGSLTGAPLEIEFRGAASVPDRAKTAELEMDVRGELARLHALAPEAERLSGRLDGRFAVNRNGPQATLKGSAEVRDLVVRLPADPARPDAGDRMVREPRLVLEADLTTQKEPDHERTSRGTVRVKGEALELEARLESVEPDALKVVAALSGDAAALLERAGVKLPAALAASGAVRTDFDGTVRRTEEQKVVAEGRVQLNGPALRRPGLVVEDLRLGGDLRGEAMRLDMLQAKVNGGTVQVRGTLDLPHPGARFDVELDAEGVGVTQYLAPLLRYVVPLYHIPEGVDGLIGGTISARVAIKGPFPPATEADLAGLEGRGHVRVDRGFVEGSPVVAEILSRLGQRGRYEFEDLDTDFHLADSTVFHDSFRAKQRELAWGFKGTTRLDTTIDYRLDPGPLLERLYRRKERKGEMKDWERVLKDVLGRLEDLPVSVGGTLDEPRLVLSVPGTTGDGKDPVGELLEGLLGGRKKK